MFDYTTQREIRAEFWRNNPQFKRHAGWKQNQYPADVRQAFCDFVEHLNRSGMISDALAERTTL